eukprot:TRINITY_DN21416_c0_g1_i1.p1 TRINITY_DN21416_c0_g1~~TRINITY_DN21416_c0_g1_i1.p1  ORF type:complete len:582 (+),score=81.60 TRINITY_DN21416_c0_g1_i1:143-1747(+)
MSTPAYKQRRFTSLQPDADSHLRCDLPQREIFDSSSSWRVPSIVRGWNPHSPLWERSAFLTSFGKYPQFVKDASGTPVRDEGSKQAVMRTGGLVARMAASPRALSLSTDDVENPAFIKAAWKSIEPPAAVADVGKVRTFDTTVRAVGMRFRRTSEMWTGQLYGRRAVLLIPAADTEQWQDQDPCQLVHSKRLPSGGKGCVLAAGGVMWVPDGWSYATCSLGPWNVAAGAQKEPPPLKLRVPYDEPAAATRTAVDRVAPLVRTMEELEGLAVNRPLGQKHSRLQLFRHILHALASVERKGSGTVRILDSAPALGAALQFFEWKQPEWVVAGVTRSSELIELINSKLPNHKFKLYQGGVDNVEGTWDVVISVENLPHEPSIPAVLRTWFHRLTAGGVAVIVGEFLSSSEDARDGDMVRYAEASSAPSLVTSSDLHTLARVQGFRVLRDQDLGSEYQIAKHQYRGKVLAMPEGRSASHAEQMAGRLLALGKLQYRCVFLRKMADADLATAALARGDPDDPVREKGAKGHRRHRSTHS